MKFTSFLYAILIAKSLSMSLPEQPKELSNEITSNVPQDINCYKSYNALPGFIQVDKINKILADTKDRKPIHIDTEQDSCGVEVFYDEGTVKISYGAIDNKSCKTPTPIVCDGISNCKVAFDCCKNSDHLLGFNCNDKYHLEPIARSSDEYKKLIPKCRLLEQPRVNKCYRLIKDTNKYTAINNSNNAVTTSSMPTSYIVTLYFALKTFFNP